MASKTEIANWALELVAQNVIGSYDQTGPVGDKVRLHYPAVVEELLEKHPLWFSERRVALAAKSGTVDDPYWAYWYAKPASMLHLIRLEPTTALALTEPMKFMVRQDTIYAQDSPVAAVYTSGDIEPGKMSISFARGVSLILASYLSMSFRTGPMDAETLLKMGEAKIDQAVTSAARQMTFRPMDQASSYENAYSGYDSALNERYTEGGS